MAGGAGLNAGAADQVDDGAGVSARTCDERRWDGRPAGTSAAALMSEAGPTVSMIRTGRHLGRRQHGPWRRPPRERPMARAGHLFLTGSTLVGPYDWAIDQVYLGRFRRHGLENLQPHVAQRRQTSHRKVPDDLGKGAG